LAHDSATRPGEGTPVFFARAARAACFDALTRAFSAGDSVDPDSASVAAFFPDSGRSDSSAFRLVDPDGLFLLKNVEMGLVAMTQGKIVRSLRLFLKSWNGSRDQ
jgi:hypothetical protein